MKVSEVNKQIRSITDVKIAFLLLKISVFVFEIRMNVLITKHIKGR